MAGETSHSTWRRKEEDPPSSSAESAPASTPASQKSAPKAVSLSEWWLIKAENSFNGNSLAISGFTTQGKQAARVFTSAPIIKRHDAYTLETADGITVTIQGFINKARTHHNGIPPEVSHCFSIGFPYNWEHYAAEYFGNESTSTYVPTSSSSNDKNTDNSSAMSAMASTPPPCQKSAPAAPFTPSSYTRAVSLFEWWLMKAENDFNGKRLAVSGFTTQGKQATRIFTSAPIIKRHDAYTLETADGITVMIQGFINKARTHHYGISPEVSRCFLIGFPYNWEHYAVEYFGNKSNSTNIPTSPFGSAKQSENPSDGSGSIYPIQLDEFPMAKILDILASISDTSHDGSITGITGVDLLNNPCKGKPTPPLACAGCNNEAWPVTSRSPNSVNAVGEQIDTTQPRVQEPEKEEVICNPMPKIEQKWPVEPCRQSARHKKS